MSYFIINIILSILNVMILFKTFSYAIYELKTNNNKLGAIVCFTTGIIAFFLIIYALWLN